MKQGCSVMYLLKLLGMLVVGDIGPLVARSPNGEVAVEGGSE